MASPDDEITVQLSDYPRRFCPNCGNLVRKNFLPGPGGRPDASCPRCRSLERHRFLAVLLDILGPWLGDPEVVLEVSPSPQTTPLLARLGARSHIRLDLGLDNRLVDVLGSLTALPHRDRSVDLLVCYHVLEHIPDDRTAMREIARVLSPSGTGLVQVPFRPGTVTDEDPDAPVEERVRRFGQADHVRYYGDDFEDRLVEAGMSFQRVTPRSALGEQMSTWLHLVPDELVWIVRTRDADTPACVPAPLDPNPTPLTQALDAMLDEMTMLQGKLLTHRQVIRRLRDRVRAAEALAPRR